MKSLMPDTLEEYNSEAGTSGSLVADVKTLVSETIPSVDTSHCVTSYRSITSKAGFDVIQ